MAMVPFYTEFPEIALKEAKRITVISEENIDILAGEYIFWESYCDDPHCDCRRVLINVVAKNGLNNILATINYGWESVEFYKNFLGITGEDIREAKLAAMPTLEILTDQSDIAPAFLELFKQQIEDENCIEKLQEHYAMFKKAIKNKYILKNKARRKNGRKIGRNQLCPCGSGKKYKKCCGKNEKADFSLPIELRTGTVLDDYMIIFQGITIYGQGLMQFGKEGKELKGVADDFKKRFRPGEDEGLPLSLFLSWLYCDFRFGDTQETVCERLLNSSYLERLNEPGPTLLRQLADSYCSFYEIKVVLDDWIIFEELGTGKEWKVQRINEPFEKAAMKGEIWYLRLVGFPEEAYIYTPPYIFSADAKGELVKATRKQKEVFLKDYNKRGLSNGEIFRESCKASTRFWAEYILMGRRR